MPATLETSLEKLLAVVQKDPKKLAVLVVLVALLGVAWVRMMGSGGGQPQKAGASAVRSVVSSKKTAPGPVLPRPHDPTARASMEQWLSTPILPISRNLFVVKYEYFPILESNRPIGSRTEINENFWDQLAKSMAARADQMEKRQHLIQNLQREASRLQFQSTMMGPNPKALINGELLGEGDVVAAFRVLKIEARRVIVEREGIRLEILMK
jgi:hypothetical protein